GRRPPRPTSRTTTCWTSASSLVAARSEYRRRAAHAAMLLLTTGSAWAQDAGEMPGAPASITALDRVLPAQSGTILPPYEPTLARPDPLVGATRVSISVIHISGNSILGPELAA